MRTILLCCCIVLIFTQYYEQDRVHEVIANYTGHPWYSGYLTIGRSKNFHYVFFTSQHDADNDPLLVWYNGGPGCSALLGMTTEIGPFLFPKNSTTLVSNPYAWNKEANLLFIESPGSVGFSMGPAESSDESTALDNRQALSTFFTKFPVMRKNEMYISGESYAGVYVPTLALNIHEYNQHHSALLKINLKGIIVGNACTHRSQCYDPRPGVSMFQYQFLYNHAFYTKSDYNRLKAACTMSYRSQTCAKIRQQLDQKFDETFTNLYGIYDKCYDPSNTPKMVMSQSGLMRQRPDCNPATGSELFFNNPYYRDILHVNEDFTGQWSACSEQVANLYKKNESQSYNIYPILMKAGYRVWVYSGDTDADVPVTGTISWIQRLREEFHVPVMQPWRQWWVYGKHEGEDQVGGMVWKLRNLTLVTVKNAGHMVPQDQPEASLVMLNTYLKGKDLNQKYEQ